MSSLLCPNSQSTSFPSPRFIARQTLKTLKSFLPMANPNPNPPPPPPPHPFDPSKPSVPISYPIKDLADLESRSYFDSFHYPFNVSSVPLPPLSLAEPLPPRRRILVCHDMMGGYADDRWVQGGTNAGAYSLWHWHLIDVFVYFSHNLVSLPPPGWTNAAHTHGVKVLGTFIAEWKEGEEICKTLLSTKESAQMYAERLAELAVALGFDGWLVNMEVNLEREQIANLKEFVSHLTQTMHTSVRGSLVIWYDSVTKDGHLDYQNQLNGKNKPFFDLCDGIFANYMWKESYPKHSAVFAGDRRFDVYMGIDVFGRGTYGGGQWHTSVALDLLKKDDISAAIFAPGWVYENLPKEDFQANQNRWWGLVDKSWGVLQSYPQALPFYSNFDQSLQGHGIHFSIKNLLADGPWNNISCQGFQPVLDNAIYHGKTTMQVQINFEDVPYSGGAQITCKGSIKDNEFFLTRLFHGQLSLEDLPLHFSYSVKADENSLLGLCLELSSNANDQVAVLLVDGIVFQDMLSSKYKKLIHVPVKKARGEATMEENWVLFEASIAMSGYTLTDISIFCCQREHRELVESLSCERISPMYETTRGWLWRLPLFFKENIFCCLTLPDEEEPKSETNRIITGEFPAYCASLGHISIQNTAQNIEFPPVDSWLLEGQHISWASSSNGTRTVSLNIIWKHKSELTRRFTNYNIFVEKLVDREYIDPSGCLLDPKQFLGIARVQAFYVSELEVPNGVTNLKFTVQACRPDGACQELEGSPTFHLAVGEE
ncbi:cytosolic endo-beta-N-acetylglucosaminidase 1-like [Iris pallida]|uniref:mannosyl-glycoprotein endo-beta-N-acetylglucosaminidase n=1 Tax=Iris pallida TaxID=29817 RepID=A0AAX6H405_IRIPA|nr:cytosolic endo-beta-N-acetylglucosaminidase 1-like [Iris pallida]KAJ6835696.1 cytosolic endo-beta-N-acetylglucosaminidase 1-like [Iris pallida]